MEIAILVACIIVYIIVGIIITINEPKSVALKVIFAPAELVFLCLGGLGLFIGWLAKKIRLAVDSEYAAKTRKESKRKELENDLRDSYSSISTVIKRETEEEEKRTRAVREKREREAYIKQKAADIASQIKYYGIVMTISVGPTGVLWSHGAYVDDEYPHYEGNLSLNFPVKEVTLNKDNYTQTSQINSAFFNAYKHNYEQYLLAQEINKHFNNPFTITEYYRYSLCSNDSFTYRCDRIDVRLTK